MYFHIVCIGSDVVNKFVPSHIFFYNVALQIKHLVQNDACIDVFLAERSQFDNDHGVDFSTPTSCQSATFVRPPLRFIVGLLFFLRKKKKKNAAFRHRRGDVYAVRLMDLRNR